MKKLVTLILASVFAHVTFAQQPGPLNESDVPAGIMTEFKEKYPNATEKSWAIVPSEVGGVEYEVKFVDGEYKRESRFNGMGHWFQTYTVLKDELIPDDISEKIEIEFEGKEYNLDRIEKTEYATGAIWYHAFLSSEGKNYKLRYNKDLKLLRRQEL